MLPNMFFSEPLSLWFVKQMVRGRVVGGGHYDEVGV